MKYLLTPRAEGWSATCSPHPELLVILIAHWNSDQFQGLSPLRFEDEASGQEAGFGQDRLEVEIDVLGPLTEHGLGVRDGDVPVSKTRGHPAAVGAVTRAPRSEGVLKLLERDHRVLIQIVPAVSKGWELNIRKD